MQKVSGVLPALHELGLRSTFGLMSRDETRVELVRQAHLLNREIDSALAALRASEEPDSVPASAPRPARP